MRAPPAAILILAALILAATRAEAAWRIGLEALSPDATRAVVVYAADWVEIDLASGRGRSIPPPLGCAWSSAAYGPPGDGFALTANCAGPGPCAAARAGLWRTAGDDRLVEVAAAEGRRWDAALWAPSGRVIVTETRIAAPRAAGLADLGRGASCGRGPGRFAAIDLGSGRAAALDVLPQRWSAVEAIGGDVAALLARLRVEAPLGPPTTAAERVARKICDAPAPDDLRAGLCRDGGMEIAADWRGGDWRFADGAEDAGGRRVATPDLSVRGRERCEGAQVDGRLKAQCEMAFDGAFGAAAFAAPEALFGDLALSPDGRWFAALAAGRGVRTRRFDLFDLSTGATRDLSPLLSLAPPWDGAYAAESP
ncbi:MAG: hypothetical protein AAGF90_07895 [Pseudomonadota bacterium]